MRGQYGPLADLDSGTNGPGPIPVHHIIEQSKDKSGAPAVDPAGNPVMEGSNLRERYMAKLAELKQDQASTPDPRIQNHYQDMINHLTMQLGEMDAKHAEMAKEKNIFMKSGALADLDAERHRIEHGSAPVGAGGVKQAPGAKPNFIPPR